MNELTIKFNPSITYDEFQDEVINKVLDTISKTMIEANGEEMFYVGDIIKITMSAEYMPEEK